MKQCFLFLSCFFLSAQVALSQSVATHPPSLTTVCPGQGGVSIQAGLHYQSIYVSSKWEYRTGGDISPWIEVSGQVASNNNWELHHSNIPVLYFYTSGGSGVTLAMNGWQFRAVFTARSNANGASNTEIASNPATLTVRYGLLGFTTQPTDRNTCPGSEVIFSAPGRSAACRSISYEWWVERKNADGTSIETPQKITEAGTSPAYSDFTTANLKVSNITAEHNGLYYRCVLKTTNPATVDGDSPNSNWARLTVIGESEITTPPSNQSVCANGNTSFGISVSASSCATYQYQWEQRTGTGAEWADVSNSESSVPAYSGATTTTLNLANVPAGHNDYQYRCKVTANNIPKYSGEATLQVVSLVITIPSPRTTCAGVSTTFEVSVTGAVATGYRWEVLEAGSWFGISQAFGPANGFPSVSGQGTATLVVGNIAVGHNGRKFRCEVSTSSVCGTKRSNEATLTVAATPAIATQPSAKNICPGSETTFDVTAASGVTGYQWQQRATTANAVWVNITGTETAPTYSGHTTASLKVASATADHHNYQYRCQLTADCGTFPSSSATLTVNALPQITHPTEKSACPNGEADFQVTVGGTGTTTYQWQYRTDATTDWTTISEAGTSPSYSDYTTNHLKVGAIASGHNNYAYRCQLTSTLCSTIFSNPAVLTVNSQPQITAPTNTSICLGTTAVFAVTVGVTGVTYQWQQRASDAAEWADISAAGTAPIYSGYTTSSLSVANAPDTHSGHQYRCRLTIAGCGMTHTTGAATLTVNAAPPQITQPTAKNVCPDYETTFAVSGGSDITAYQWQQRASETAEWATISAAGTAPTYSGHTTPSLKVANAETAHNNYQYQYRCQLTAGCGIFHSDLAVLTVSQPPTTITHPTAKSACLGAETVFAVTVDGSASDITGYQWQQRSNATADWANISETGTSLSYSDYTSNSLKLNTITSSHNGYQYRCQLTSTLCGTTFGPAAALTVTQPVVTPPTDQSVCAGQEAIFKVSATTHASCITAYQWQQRASATTEWADITEAGTSPRYSGHTTEELKVNDITVSHKGYQYRCRLRLTSVTQDIEPASLYVDPLLEIITHPKDSLVKEGNPNAGFRIKAKGIALKYQWQVSHDQGKTWADLKEAGAKPTYEGWAKDLLLLKDIPPLANGYRYRCHLSSTSCSGKASEATSNVATLTREVSTGLGDQLPAGEVTLQVFPNPARHLVNVKLWHFAQGKTTAALYNLAGQKVWSDESMKSGETLTKEISIGHLPNGLYILKMVVESAAPLQTKVLVAH